MYEGLTIGYLLDFLRGLLQDRAKDVLRKRTPDQRAKELSFKLYKQLRLVAEQSRAYVDSLAELIGALKREIDPSLKGSKGFAGTAEGSNIVRRADAVNASAIRLADEMADLQESLKAMSPQLEIHKPEVVDDLVTFKGDRDEVVRAADDLLASEVVRPVRWRPAPVLLKSERPRYLLTCRDDLWEVYVRARDNQVNIEAVCEDFRAFLVGQFAFRESF